MPLDAPDEGKDQLAGIDRLRPRLAIITTAFRTWAAAIVNAAAQQDPAPFDLAFDRHGSGFIRPRVEGVQVHDTACLKRDLVVHVVAGRRF